MAKLSETDLYAPIKTWLEGLGYDVKAEVGAADVVAVRNGEVPLIVEMKLGFSLTLLHQAVARQSISDNVYVAVPRWSGKTGWRTFKRNVGLCKRLALGVVSVQLSDGSVQVHADPREFKPRKSNPRRSSLMSEFTRREGDPNTGGTNGKVVTAYLQDAQKCADHLLASGSAKGADVKGATGVVNATRIMRDNHYGWFAPLGSGVYTLTPAGRARRVAGADS